MNRERTPFGRRLPLGPGIEDQRRVMRALDEIDLVAPARGLGMPTGWLRVEDCVATYGDLVYVDPTTRTADGRGVYIQVSLPKGESSRIGEVVTVKNYSASTNKVRLQPVTPDTIDKADYADIDAAWGQIVCKLIAEEEWIAFAMRGTGSGAGTWT